MATRKRDQLQEWFKKGKYPKQEHFWDWIDSFWHKEEDEIPMHKIGQLPETLNRKYDQSAGEDLERRMEKAEDHLTDHDLQITNIYKDLKDHEERLDECEDTLEDHEKRITIAEETIEEHEKKIELIDTSIKAFSTTGDGNAITSIDHAEDGLTLIATKGNTFVDLASVQTISGVKTFDAQINFKSINASEKIIAGTRIDASSTDSGIVLTPSGTGYFSNNIQTGVGKIGGPDGVTGCFVGANGNIGLTSATNPSIYFYKGGSTTQTMSLMNIGTNILQIEGSVYPNVDNQRILGAPSARWSNGYINNLYTGTKTSASDNNAGLLADSTGYIYASGNFYIGTGKYSIEDGNRGVVINNIGSIHIQHNENPYIDFYRAGSTSNVGRLILYASNQLTTNCSILPADNNTYNLGASSAAWGNLYMENHLWVGKIRSATDTNTGVIVAPTGNIYLRSATNPGIHFYRNNSSSVTSSIIEAYTGTISIPDKLYIGGIQTGSQNDALLVKGNALIEGDLDVTGNIIANGKKLLTENDIPKTDNNNLKPEVRTGTHDYTLSLISILGKLIVYPDENTTTDGYHINLPEDLTDYIGMKGEVWWNTRGTSQKRITATGGMFPYIAEHFFAIDTEKTVTTKKYVGAKITVLSATQVFIEAYTKI